jgi:hypothetical protein
MKICQRCQRFVSRQTLTRFSNNIISIYMMSALSALLVKLKRREQRRDQREELFRGSFNCADTLTNSIFRFYPLKINKKSCQRLSADNVSAVDKCFPQTNGV